MKYLAWGVLGVSAIWTLASAYSVRRMVRSGQPPTRQTVNMVMLWFLGVVCIPALGLSAFHIIWWFPVAFIVGMLSLAFPFYVLNIPGELFGTLCCLGLNQTEQPRVTAIVEIPPGSAPTVKFSPEQPSEEDLVRLGLTYGAKLRWLLLSEPMAAQEEFEIMFAELRTQWSRTRTDLIEHMPTARTVRHFEGRPLAVAAGERFVIRYSRRDDKTFRSVSSVVNSLPRPGLASNIVWNYFLLMDAIHRQLDNPTRARAQRAFDVFATRILTPERIERSQSGLEQLFTEADYAWEVSAIEQVARPGP